MGLRAIPTWVGKSAYTTNARRLLTGHPHVGGEISQRMAVVGIGAGPSPRGWGNQAGNQLGA